MTIFDLVANREYQNKHVLTKLIEHHLGVPYKEIILHYDDEILESKAQSIVSDYFAYEKDKKPLEYIVGEVEFLGNSFAIDERAMIPRPETEYMINWVVEYIEAEEWKLSTKGFCVLDLGCGCGVLGLSVLMLSLRNGISVSHLESWDISVDAIELTKKNVARHQQTLDWIVLKTCVSEGLKALEHKAELLSQRQDQKLIIVCNYPYIPDETFEINADECAKTWEPRIAFLGGPDGLDLYRILFGEIEHYNLTGAVLFLEMMTWQMELLVKEFGDRIQFQLIKTFHFNIIIVQAQWHETKVL